MVQLMYEIAMLARVLKDVTACHKLNIGAIGNIVPQLHVHLVARPSDAAWPRPVWGAVAARPTSRTSATASSPPFAGRSPLVEAIDIARIVPPCERPAPPE